MRKIALIFLVSLLTIACRNQNNGFKSYKDQQGNEIIDQFNNVVIYYNNGTNKRNTAPDGYNLGLKWQCVEFVKRYYFLHLNHKMPNSYGNAKDFYNPRLKDGQMNKGRNLIQFSNKSTSKPQVNDIVIFKGNTFNKYGHVAIIANVSDDQIEIVQQNVGRQTRATYKLYEKNGLWVIKNELIVGRLRKNE
jgi:surface antigen